MFAGGLMKGQKRLWGGVLELMCALLKHLVKQDEYGSICIAGLAIL